MKKYDETLFQIGEVAKILGISRKMLLNYEEIGLLTPAVKDENSGYRYYTADNMTQIKSIRSLQSLGLSLREVAGYYYDTENLDAYLKRLTDLRAALDRNIQMLQVRAAKPGDMTVRRVTLARQVCFCQRFLCKDVADATENLRRTYVAAARSGFMSLNGRMFSRRVGDSPEITDMQCCIPVDDDFEGEERVEFPETQALCIYYRGPYDNTLSAIRALEKHLAENGISAAGAYRSIYLEGPPNRGANSAYYITQVAVPVADRRYQNDDML